MDGKFVGIPQGQSNNSSRLGGRNEVERCYSNIELFNWLCGGRHLTNTMVDPVTAKRPRFENKIRNY